MVTKPHRQRPPAVDDTPAKPPETPPTDEKIDRVSFPLAKDGSIAADQLRPATRDKIRQAFATPAARAAIFGDAPSSDDGGWFTVAGQLTELSGTLAAVIVDRLGYGKEQARSFIPTADETKVIATPAAIGLRETFGSLDQSWQASLGLAIVSVFLPKIVALKKPADVVSFPQPAAVPDQPQTAS